MLNNYQDINNLSTSLLAEKCYVSKASISRFCKTICVEDFAELKVLAKMQDNNTYEKFYFERNSKNESLDFLYNVESKMEFLKQDEFQQQLDHLVKNMQQHKNIILMGLSQSINYAYLLQQDLLHFHRFASCIDSIHEQ